MVDPMAEVKVGKLALYLEVMKVVKSVETKEYTRVLQSVDKKARI